MCAGHGESCLPRIVLSFFPTATSGNWSTCEEEGAEEHAFTSLSRCHQPLICGMNLIRLKQSLDEVS